MIGGFPSADGDAYADFFTPLDDVMAFPGSSPFEDPDSAELARILDAAASEGSTR